VLQLISWEPVKPSKLACWEALVAALGAVCPDATVNALPFKRREEAIEHATGELELRFASWTRLQDSQPRCLHYNIFVNARDLACEFSRHLT
jgi:hypothetical protein